jgi:hypothetical protein
MFLGRQSTGPFEMNDLDFGLENVSNLMVMIDQSGKDRLQTIAVDAFGR